MLSEREGSVLLRAARRALEAHFGVADGDTDDTDIRTPDGIGGVFATLKRDGELRGCIGYMVPNLELTATTERAVVAAATDDPRFHPVTADEVPELRISISVLAESVPVEDFEDIVVGRDGLIVERDGARGLLLPQVASERGWDRTRFLAETCAKAGLPPDSWREPETVVWRFGSIQFDEYSVNRYPQS